MSASRSLEVMYSAITILLLLQFCFSRAVGDGPCRTVYNTSTGSLYSVNYPNMYADNSECEYFIRPVLNEAYILKLVPVDFDLEGGYDTLEVRETGPHGTYRGHFSGTIMPILYGKAFWMRFTSDFRDSRKGFNFTWTVVTEGVRLVNGTNGLEGRIELFHAGKWGTICDDALESAEAIVTCKMLGFMDLTAQHFNQAHFGRGVDPIWLDNTKCTNNMTSLSQCRTESWSQHNCNHGEDSGVRCTAAANSLKRLAARMNSFPKGCSSSFMLSTGSLTSPQFPLYPNFAQCHYSITPPKNSSDIIRLSFSVFDLQDGADFLEIREDGPSGVFLGRFTGSRLPPIIYAKSLWLSFTSDDSFGQQGFKATWEPSSTGIRLRNGTFYNEGRVEIYRQAQWGTICDDSWDINEATVACRMLGYNDDYTVNATAHVKGEFGPGLGEILFDDMSCVGSEDDIHDCSFSDTHNCNHYEDAGLRCTSFTPISPNADVYNKNGSSEQIDIADAVNVICDSKMLKVIVNLTELGDAYSDLINNNMYLTLAKDDCVGQRDSDSDTITFNYDMTDCGMTATESSNYIIYRNRLVSHDNGTLQANGTESQTAFVVPIYCKMDKMVRLAGRMRVYKKTKKTKPVSRFGNFTAQLDFYKDPGFNQKIKDYPMYVELGEEMYSQASIVTSDKYLKLILYECLAVNNPDSPNTETHTLVSNRCSKDSSTRLLPSPSNWTSRFLFKTFQFVQRKGEVFIKCSLLVCNVTDKASRCKQECQTPSRVRRSAVDAKRIVHVMQGPFILKSSTKTASNSAKNIHLGLIIAVCVVTALVVLTVVLVVAFRRKKKVEIGFINRVYDEYDNHTDQTMMIPMESTPATRD